MNGVSYGSWSVHICLYDAWFNPIGKMAELLIFDLLSLRGCNYGY